MRRLDRAVLAMEVDGRDVNLLIAQAAQEQFTVVTQERPDALARKRIVIPEACQHLGVHFISPFELMRQEGLRLILDQSP